MSITFTETKEVEYGTKDYDVQKELIKEVRNAELKEVPVIDTMKIGDQTLKFVLVKDNLEKEVDYKISIKDTKAPEIEFKEDSIELTVGDEFDIKSNINSVKDPIDGDIKENDKALELNKKATEEYNKLKKEDIKDDTKVAEKALNDFLIEDIKDKEEKNLYLKNCYYIDGSVDTEKADEYTITIVVVDKNGLKSTSEYKVTVKEKEVEKPQTSVGSGSYTSNSNGNVSSSGGGNSSSGGNSSVSVSKQGISAVINSALGQVGTSYVWGGSAPGGFDCSGLIFWAFNSNGYSIPRAVNGAGYSIGTNLANAQAGDILAYSGHSNLITSVSTCGEDEGMSVYCFSYVTALDGVGVVSRNSPTIIRQDGKVLQGSQDWIDIRRVR